ncbi:MAG: disulfide bond formation protein DsbB [Gammaproteobacteria bacterium]|nr:disulfide bond formation protein DsbB [Gammaproteobacteria bacterium]
MLNFLNNLATKRIAWLSLFLVATAFEITALIFQYGLGLEPCVMCIYQRTAILGIAIAGLIGAIAPSYAVSRWIGYLIWGYSAIKGLLIAIEHVEIQTNPSPFFTCDFAPDFPSWLKLDQLIPSFFQATGDCADISWMFAGYSMSQWMIVIFGAFTLALTIIALNRLRVSNRFLP